MLVNGDRLVRSTSRALCTPHRHEPVTALQRRSSLVPAFARVLLRPTTGRQDAHRR